MLVLLLVVLFKFLGTYYAGSPMVQIAAFAPQLHVISSKQRPRKLTIHGSDGAEYMFLLKVIVVWGPCRRAKCEVIACTALQTPDFPALCCFPIGSRGPASG